MNSLTKTTISELLLACQSAEFKENKFNNAHLDVFSVSGKTENGEFTGFSLSSDSAPDRFYVVGISEEVVAQNHFFRLSIWENSQSVFSTKNYYHLHQSEVNEQGVKGLREMVASLFTEANLALYQQEEFFAYLLEKRNVVPNDEIFKFVDFVSSDKPFRFNGTEDNYVF